MTAEDESPDRQDLDVLRTVERAIWRSGTRGDACARVAATVLQALAEAGYVVQRKPGG